MPTYSRISVAVSPKEEAEIKAKARENSLSLSAYCKSRILEPQEEPPSRVLLESEIEKLGNRVASLEKTLLEMSKGLFMQSRINSNLTMAFLHLALDDPKEKYDIYNEAEKDAEEFIAKLFEEEKKNGNS